MFKMLKHWVCAPLPKPSCGLHHKLQILNCFGKYKTHKIIILPSFLILSEFKIYFFNLPSSIWNRSPSRPQLGNSNTLNDISILVGICHMKSDIPIQCNVKIFGSLIPFLHCRNKRYCSCPYWCDGCSYKEIRS